MKQSSLSREGGHLFCYLPTTPWWPRVSSAEAQDPSMEPEGHVAHAIHLAFYHINMLF